MIIYKITSPDEKVTVARHDVNELESAITYFWENRNTSDDLISQKFKEFPYIRTWKRGTLTEDETTEYVSIVNAEVTPTKSVEDEPVPIKEKRVSPNKGKTSNMKGRTYEKVTCPHCKKETSGPSIKRFHFDNCKMKP